MGAARKVNYSKRSVPEDYMPAKLPVLIKKMEERKLEKIIETATIEGVEFTILEKPKTLYAGFHTVAADVESEPDVHDTYSRFQEGHTSIADAASPECMICFSIGYREWNHTHDFKREFFHGKETSNPQQPEGVKVIEAPPCVFIRVKATDETWALTKKVTGEDNPIWHMAPLFGLMLELFCNSERGYAAGSDGNHETEYYYFDGSQYAAIPVRRIN